MAEYVVLGRDGMLGRSFVQKLGERGADFVAHSRANADLSSREALRRATQGARVVLNCGAYTNVDGAETDEATATLINGTAVGWLAELCRERGAVLVNYGTDYVFDGAATSPYPVDAPRAPLNAYGRSKAVGEELLERSEADYLHLRTSWVYAPWGKNFVLTMKKFLFEKDVLRVVDDQRGRPTSALWLAEGTLRLLDRGARGTWHLTDGGECTWFELTRTIAEILGAPARVDPCTSAEYPRPARRPAYSTLDVSKTTELLGEFPDFRAHVREALALSGG
ncbi:MAG TPA: dTDP-4-dehydrorhamnose reductase [Polyangiaceae bacterium]|nr:dTDP-4-dehydrorhamnose reductase [Polyangiaceae bacterium]